MRDGELTSLIGEVLPFARFRVSGVEEELDAGVFRDRYEAATNQIYFERHDARPSDFILAKTLLHGRPIPGIDRLHDSLRDLAAPYAEDEGANFWITAPLPAGQILGVTSHYRDLAHRAVRCAALHGTTETVELLVSLFTEEAIRYERTVVVAGARPSKGHSGIEVLPGVSLIDFRDKSCHRGPRVFEDLPESLAFSDNHQTPMSGFVRPAVQYDGALQFDLVHENPVRQTDTDEYYMPDDSGHQLIYVYDDDDCQLPSTDLLNALSLVGGHPVTEIWAWHRFDVRFCTLVGYCSQAYRYVQRHGHMSRLFTAEDVPRLRDAHSKIQAEGAKGLRPMIRRWGKISAGSDLVEMATDLRITLEALFLDDGDDGEYGFRVALRGAWYLGDEETRLTYFKNLKSAYGFCSQAIHRGEIKRKDQDKALKVIESARQLCQQALLKRVEEGHKLNWEEIVLGIPQQTS
ncbi:MAG: hypothetical protein OXH23_00150 [bacterium]|nr:hypothetical protein [bacterium]